MPKPPVPNAVDRLLAGPNKAVMATVGPTGDPLLVATWYLWEHGRILLNMYKDRKRVARLAEDPRVSLLVLADEDWTTYVSLRGRVTETYDDVDCRDINRISMHYDGMPFDVAPGRGRVSFLVDVDRWFGWGEVASQPH
jgi:PPOX class probable F420-dependent enzyme